MTNALKAVGYAESKIIALKGEDGVDMLERLQDLKEVVVIELV